LEDFSKNEKEFLLKLADLCDEYNVAICSAEMYRQSQVFFQFRIDTKYSTVDTKRTHSTGYELRAIALEKENKLLSLINKSIL